VITLKYPDKFTSPETRGIVLPDADAENRTIVSSFIWIQYWSVRTEGQRDRQTDGQIDGIALASTALCMASHANAL